MWKSLWEKCERSGRLDWGTRLSPPVFDTHNAVGETLPHGEAIRKYDRYIKHVHVNELDGRHPGTGDYDFKPVLQALKDLAYPGWVSLEVFHFEHGPENIARDSARFIRDLEKELG
ncbi:MAG: TIM barrel protein [Acidobacteriota bacterium]|nr:TIM barrel protein [Acidobacteriota bacterium]